MSNINEIVVRYVAAWNERDPKRRRDLIANTWCEDDIYRDAHRHSEGHAAIDAMIDVAQRQFPGYRVALKSGIEAPQWLRALQLGRRRDVRCTALSGRNRFRRCGGRRPS